MNNPIHNRAVRRTLLRACLLPSHGARSEIGVYEEMLRGALVGLSASIFMTWNLPLLGTFGAAVAGLWFGSVIGLVLWSGSASLPKDRVLPPAPGQGRVPLSIRAWWRRTFKHWRR
jgi:hypothetical protein